MELCTDFRQNLMKQSKKFKVKRYKVFQDETIKDSKKYYKSLK